MTLVRRLPVLLILAAAPAARAQAPEAAPGEVIVIWQPSAVRPAPGAVAGRRVVAARRLDREAWLYRLESRSQAAVQQAMAVLAATPGVAHVEPNYIRRPFRVPNDPHYAVQWHLKAVNLEQAWDRTTGSTSTVVAVVDTGIRPGHPDLAGRLLQGHDFITDPVAAGDGDGRDADPFDNGDAAPTSSGLHGTHVAGIIGAATGNGQGMAGVDWACRVLPVRALGIQEGKGKDSDIAAAIRWAAGLDVADVPRNPTPAKVINLSFGAPGYGALLDRAIQEVQDHGVIVVAAAGNDGVDAGNIYPAAFPNVITVGATRLGGGRASYSNFGTTVDLMAPGGSLSQTLPSQFQNRSWSAAILGPIFLGSNATYEMLEGTSQAAPVVAGVISLMLGVNGALDGRESLRLLQWTANPQGRCDEGCGAGLINADAALAATAGETRVPTTAWPGFVPGGEIRGTGCSAGPGTSFLPPILLVLAGWLLLLRSRRHRRPGDQSLR
jgi:serine protease